MLEAPDERGRDLRDGDDVVVVVDEEGDPREDAKRPRSRPLDVVVIVGSDDTGDVPRELLQSRGVDGDVLAERGLRHRPPRGATFVHRRDTAGCDEEGRRREPEPREDSQGADVADRIIGGSESNAVGTTCAHSRRRAR